jgi:peptidoglycan/LPS O-acetylase OafA/YrhL
MDSPAPLAAVAAPPVDAAEPHRGRRLGELDALRGLAALSVVAYHCLHLQPSFRIPSQAGIFDEPPLDELWNGTQAVFFFFVLSGFVLARPYLTPGSGPSPVRFWLRRLFRLYPLYLVAMVIAVGMVWLTSPSTPAVLAWGDPAWAPRWTVALTLAPVLDHLTLLGAMNNALYDPPVWSLVQEARLSLLLPLVVWCIRRYPTWMVVAACAAMWVVEPYLQGGGIQPAWVPLTGYASTLQYLPMFVCGGLLAKHQQTLVSRASTLSRRGVTAVGLLAALFYAYPETRSLPANLHSWQIDDFFILLAVSSIMVLAMARSGLRDRLRRGLFAALGRWSYGIYLLHMIFLLGFADLLVSRAPMVVVWLLTVAVTIPLAAIAYRWVELPFIALGRRLTGRRGSLELHSAGLPSA